MGWVWGVRGTPFRYAPLRPLPMSPASRYAELVSVGPLPLYLSGGGQAPGHPTPIPTASGCVCFARFRESGGYRLRCDGLLQRLYPGIFAQVVGQSDEPELDFDLFIPPETEPLEAMVVFDVPEHGLRFDRTPAPVIESLLAGQAFFGLGPEGVAPVIDFDDPSVPIPLVA